MARKSPELESFAAAIRSVIVRGGKEYVREVFKACQTLAGPDFDLWPPEQARTLRTAIERYLLNA